MFRKIARRIPAVFLFATIFLLLTMTFYLIAFKQTVLVPYKTTDVLEGTGSYAELKDILPEALQDSDEMKDITSDKELNTVFGEVLEEQLTLSKIKEMILFIEKDIWDYILDDDQELEALDIQDIRAVLIEEINDSENMKNRVIYLDKFIEDIEWSSSLNVKAESLDRLKGYYERVTSLMVVSSLLVIILMGLSFLLFSNVRKTIHWLSGTSVVTGITLLVSVILLHVIGIDWMYSTLDLPGHFAPLNDNIEIAIDRLYVQFLSALLACSGFSLITGIGLFWGSFYKKKDRVEVRKSAA